MNILSLVQLTEPKTALKSIFKTIFVILISNILVYYLFTNKFFNTPHLKFIFFTPTLIFLIISFFVIISIKRLGKNIFLYEGIVYTLFSIKIFLISTYAFYLILATDTFHKVFIGEVIILLSIIILTSLNTNSVLNKISTGESVEEHELIPFKYSYKMIVFILSLVLSKNIFHGVYLFFIFAALIFIFSAVNMKNFQSFIFYFKYNKIAKILNNEYGFQIEEPELPKEYKGNNVYNIPLDYSSKNGYKENPIYIENQSYEDIIKNSKK